MTLESFLFSAGLYSLLAAVVISAIAVVAGRRKLKLHGGKNEKRPGTDRAALVVSALSVLIVSAFIVARALRTGHGPFTNMYEFSVAFTWGILIMGVYFSLQYGSIVVNLFAGAVGACLLFFAGSLSSEAQPLVPALQNSLLLSAHVISAVIAYGAFTIGFITSIQYLLQKNDRFASLPDSRTLEKISYHSVMIGFPFMTLVIVLGALWADITWGSYWSWDPKETASLVTWLIYAGYMHTRIIRKWRGKRSAILLVVGFASVIFTFFGNYLFNGLHSY